MISRNIAALVAASLVMSSSAAIAQSAQPLSLANTPAATRAGADLQQSNKLEGATLYIVGAIVVGLLIWGAIELFDSNDDGPSSP
jgi:hypothetical protein